MSEASFRRFGDSGSRLGHEFVTGRATVEPAGAREPSEQRSTEVADHIEAWARNFEQRAAKAWHAAIECMQTYPLAVLLTGIGVGFLMARMGQRR